MRTTHLESAKEHYKKARNEVNMVLCEEQKKLLNKQKELQDKFKREFLELSLHDTVYRLLIMREFKIAEEMRINYRISDRKYVVGAC